MRHVKRLTARPGDLPQTSFILPQHVEDCLSAIESSNKTPKPSLRVSKLSLLKTHVTTHTCQTIVYMRGLKKLRRQVESQVTSLPNS